MAVAVTIVAVVVEGDLPELRPLMRAYCDFYGVAPSDADLLALSRGLIADPEHEGVQLIARDGDKPLGFATIFWTWSTTAGGRVATMNDLYVDPRARGTGAADALIEACVERCRERGDVVRLEWKTALDNERAQRVYDRVGAVRSRWLDYAIDL